MLLDYQETRLAHGLDRSVSAQKERLGRLAAALDAMSPLKVLGRGYSIAQRPDGGIITSVQTTQPGEPFTLRLSDGEAACRFE